MKRNQFWIIAITTIIFWRCEAPPDEIEVIPNHKPSVTSIRILNTIVFNHELSYDREYSFVCHAEDEDENENDTLTYNWIFTYRDFTPYVWRTYHDTISSLSDRVTWRTRASNDLTIKCVVEDQNGELSDLTVFYSVKTPTDLSNGSWKIHSFFISDSLPEIMVEEEFILNIESSPYYSILGECENRFGRLSVWNDTLSFDQTSDTAYPDTCSGNISTLAIGIIGLNRYTYDVRNDTLDFFLGGDTTNLIFARLLAY